ncbi:carbohydrate ABC transporter permease [Tengunoibacter tsumagoiensis]|uniref:ABC transporter permease n=1 Tax=Tengunoibacter tsumagoiensis TaxID=2014871 RepID=A0A402A633_9CHLR|nr:sugar ABC transporter permease [Tengunoibacter tsumagoiensis]GCE14607.1 ABC transporter permease [Tengunoibacter tsumagoiensis]
MALRLMDDRHVRQDQSVRARPNMWRKKVFPYLCLAPTVILMAVLIVYPLLNAMEYSFTNANDGNIERHIGVITIPATYKFVGLQNFINILAGKAYSISFGTLLLQTVLWVVVSVVFHFIIGLGLALLLNRHIRFRGVYRAAMMIPWAMPQYVTAFGWSFILNQNYGIINQVLLAIGRSPIPWTLDVGWARFALLGVNIWLGFPFYVVTLLGGLQNIPVELSEAAVIDGAGFWQRLRYIIAPLLRPVASLTVLLDIIWTFNFFSIIYFITRGAPNGGTDTITSFAYENPIQSHFFGLGSAYAMLILIILLIITVLYVRLLRIQKGVE